jgi:chitin disaccharide deacetylase
VHFNPVLHKLGFADNERVAIIHTDDIGMCQASVSAYAELIGFGLVSSGTTMVPCPWFLETARFCREHPRADMGVHLTLTSEWETYRWGPISTGDTSSGMLDEQGYFYRDTPSAQANADADAVLIELDTQISRAISAGIQPTHLDSHMGTLVAMKFMPGYVQLGMKYQMPIMMFRMDQDGWQRMGLDAATAQIAAQMVEQMEEMGMPLLDYVSQMNLAYPEDRLEQAMRAFDALPAGITHFIIHPCVDTPELRAITPDWRCRVADYETFRDERLREYLKSRGIQVIGYRPLRELMRVQPS